MSRAPIYFQNNLRAQIEFANFRQQILKDLDDVGPEKPLGYLPGYTLKVLLREDLRILKRKYRKKGLTVRILSKKRTTSRTSRFYVFDREAVKKHIDDNLFLIRHHSWPTHPDGLVEMIAKVHLHQDHGLMPLVKKLFADPY